MAAEEQGAFAALDPDAPAGRAVRGGASRPVAAAKRSTQPRADDQQATSPDEIAEAILSLEPLRLPIATMVQGTLRTEREALERMGADLHAELGGLREWRVREEATRAEQTALCSRAADEWRGAADTARALQGSVSDVTAAARELRGAVEAAGARFWRRAMLAAWLVSLAGLGLVAGLCGVVWLAVAHR